MSADNLEPTGGDGLTPALELSAAEVANAPLLGYWLQNHGNTWSDRTEPTRQRWIERSDNRFTINIECFRRARPFDRLLVRARTSHVPSLLERVGDFAQRWAVSGELFDQTRASSPLAALSIHAGATEVLVWRNGIVIGAPHPLAITLRLFTKNFSQEARKDSVYAKPGLLESVLALLPQSIKSTYVPDADDYVFQANHEMSCEKQNRLRALAQGGRARRRPTDP